MYFEKEMVTTHMRDEDRPIRKLDHVFSAVLYKSQGVEHMMK